MKHALTLLFSMLLLCTLAAQKPQPVQIQTIDTSTYVVEYVPIATAQANVNAQLVQVDKQIQTVEKQIAELVKKRDQLMQQQAALTLIDKQLDQAAATPPPPVKTGPQTAPPPQAEKKVKKPKKN
jgi:TolA-binding protein